MKWYIEQMHPESNIYAPVAEGYSVATQDAFTQAVNKRVARMQMLAHVCRTLGFLVLALVALVGLCSSVIPRLLGMQSYAIVSGSMESEYPTGSLVYATPAAGSSLQVGDVAVFWRDEDVIVHRVEEINTEEHELITKGDANPDVDVRPVPYSQVLGRVVVCVPYAGYFLMTLGSTSGKLLLGWIVLMGAGFCLVGSVVNALAFQSETKQG